MRNAECGMKGVAKRISESLSFPSNFKDAEEGYRTELGTRPIFFENFETVKGKSVLGYETCRSSCGVVVLRFRCAYSSVYSV